MLLFVLTALGIIYFSIVFATKEKFESEGVQKIGGYSLLFPFFVALLHVRAFFFLIKKEWRYAFKVLFFGLIHYPVVIGIVADILNPDHEKEKEYLNKHRFRGVASIYPMIYKEKII